MRLKLQAIIALVPVLIALAACGGAGSQPPELSGVWWPPETPRMPQRLVLAAPDEPDPLEWWRLNVYSLVPAAIYQQGQATFADELVAETNRVRASYGLNEVARRTELDRVAQAHAIDQATRDYWAHRTPEGLGSRQRVEAATGLSTYGAENSSAGIPGTDTARQIVRAWELSPSHRELLLDPKVDSIGIGIYTYSPAELAHYVQLLYTFPR